MYSVGDIVDKLIVENIKIFSIRERLHSCVLNDEEYVDLNNKMITLNENRGTISNLLDEKIEAVAAKKEQNRILKPVKTYGIKTT
jgi:hypothetical protein|tara:strand:+ start:181 stop:435 length:255 start_codon:yes stop_codon:yes gene_type:complete